VTEQRSKVIHNYLSALLAEPLVRACVRGRWGRACVRAWGVWAVSYTHLRAHET